MATTTLELFRNFSVNVESTEVLTPEEEAIVTEGLQNSFCWIFLGQHLPDFFEIKGNIDRLSPNISQKLRRIYRH